MGESVSDTLRPRLEQQSDELVEIGDRESQLREVSHRHIDKVIKCHHIAQVLVLKSPELDPNFVLRGPNNCDCVRVCLLIPCSRRPSGTPERDLPSSTALINLASSSSSWQKQNGAASNKNYICIWFKV